MKRPWVAGGLVVLATVVAGWMLGASLTDPRGHGARPPNAISSTGLTLAAVRVDGRDRLIVTSLRSGSPALASGLRVGDAIEQFDGRAVASLPAFDAMLTHDKGCAIAIAVGRGGQVVHIRLVEPAGETDGEQQDLGGRGRRCDR